MKKNKNFNIDGVEFKMVFVEGGTFTMGATPEQGKDTYKDEYPMHEVTLSDYYIGETEVTQALWKAVMGNNPSFFKGNSLPVENVSYNDVKEFITKLNQKTGKTFRLPTEAEWEYAARGGKKSKGYKYSGSDNINDVAWYKDNSDDKTHPVKTKRPNELGIYDMSGNVLEWCSDWYGSYSNNAQTNPQGHSSGSYRVIRGGAWSITAGHCRASYRSYVSMSFLYYYIGFRLVMANNNNNNNNNMKEVKINIPEGYVIDKENSTFECIKFKRKELPKTWEEFCDNSHIKEGEFFVDALCRINEAGKGPRDPITAANTLPNKEYAKAIIALCQLIQLRDCYNDGWQPDWESFETKYSICIDQNRVMLTPTYKISHLLTFRTPIIREMFYMNFKDIIEKAKILL